MSEPLHPRDSYRLEGIEPQAEAFEAALARGRLHHAWLLTGPEGALDRVFGLYQPTTSLRRLMGRPIQALTLEGVRLAGAPRRPHLRLVALDGVRLD